MADEQFKRNVAYKFRIGDLLKGSPVMDGERFAHLDLNGKRVVRVNIVGSVVDKYESDGEKKYIFFTIDDGSGQIKTKSFGDDTDKLKEISQGQTVVVIGVLRHFNDEVYISPEVMKPLDPRYLLVRKIETEKNESPVSANAEGNSPKPEQSLREKITGLIKNAESDGGIELEKLISELSGNSPESINSEIQKLLEEGVIFEPRPGMIRWLG